MRQCTLISTTQTSIHHQPVPHIAPACACVFDVGSVNAVPVGAVLLAVDDDEVVVGTSNGGTDAAVHSP